MTSEATLPHLTVIVPFYSVRRDWFEECIQSIVNCANNNRQVIFEIRVIDDSSPIPPPQPAELTVEPLQNVTFELYKNERNLGLAGTRNVTLSSLHANGYSVFLDADDLLLGLPSLGDSDIYIGNSVFFSDEDKFDWHKWHGNTNYFRTQTEVNTESFGTYLLWSNPAPVSAYFIRNSLLKTIRFREDLVACEDWGFWIDLFDHVNSMKGSAKRVNCALTAIRKSSQSMSAYPQKMFYARTELFTQLAKTSRSIQSRYILDLQILLGNHLFKRTSYREKWNLLHTLLKLLCQLRKKDTPSLLFKSRTLFFGLAICLVPALVRFFICSRYKKRGKKRGFRVLSVPM